MLTTTFKKPIGGYGCRLELMNCKDCSTVSGANNCRLCGWWEPVEVIHELIKKREADIELLANAN